MKKLAILICIASVFTACNEANEPLPLDGVPGTWQLTETLADPGDGSGTYQPIDSDKKIEFRVDGTFTSTRQMCSRGNSTSEAQSGTYSLSDSTLTVSGCQFPNSEEAFQLSFSIDGNDLYIRYPCIEPCGEKYELVN